MSGIAKLDKGERYYHRTDEQLAGFAAWRPEFAWKAGESVSMLTRRFAFAPPCRGSCLYIGRMTKNIF